jgi:hypothetical protein
VLARSLNHLRLQPLSHAVAASITYGYSLSIIRLQPPSRTVAGFNVLTRSLSREGRPLGAVSAPLLLSHFMVATFACVGDPTPSFLTNGCSLYHIRLQPLAHTVAGAVGVGATASGLAQRDGWSWAALEPNRIPSPNPNPNPKPKPKPKPKPVLSLGLSLSLSQTVALTLTRSWAALELGGADDTSGALSGADR